MQQTALTFEQKQAEYIRLMEAELEIKRTRNDIFEAYREFRGRYAVLIGGSGSGKSYEIADKLVDRIVHEDGHRILCVRAQLKQVRQSQIPLIESRIDRRYDIRDFKINRSLGNESIVYKPNGNEFLFWGLDDPGKLKSIFDITSDWIEEADQTTDAALREINRRLRGYQGTNSNGTPKYMQHSLSFNPVSVLSWLNDRFFKRKKANQIMLHGQIPFTDCKQYLSALYDLKRTDTLVIHSTFLDNKFIDAEYESVLRELKEFDEDEYNVYALGMWGVSGGIYFDATNVNARIMANPQPIKQGYFEYAWNDPESFDKIIGGFAYDLDEDENVERRLSRDIKWIDDPSGPIKLFTEPIFGHPYVAGGDTAGEGSDYNTGAFTDNTTGADVASLRTLMDEDEYARQMYCLGRYYNDALMAIETNFSTHPVKELERLHYPNQYMREETPDKFTGKLVPRFGFRTDKLTRPLALGMLRTVAREHPDWICDVDTLYEMTTFVKNEKGRPGAAQGAHDDMIMARAINCYVAPQQTKHIKEKPKGVPLIKSHKEKMAQRNRALMRQGILR